MLWLVWFVLCNVSNSVMKKTSPIFFIFQSNVLGHFGPLWATPGCGLILNSKTILYLYIFDSDASSLYNYSQNTFLSAYIISDLGPFLSPYITFECNIRAL